MKFKSILSLVSTLGFVFYSTVEALSPKSPLKIDHVHIQMDVHPDFTYEQIQEVEIKILTHSGIAKAQIWTQDFFPAAQSLKIIEAYVVHPNGNTVRVPASNMFVRPAAASQNSPGFTASMTQSVVFPQLYVGSRCFIKYKLNQLTPPLLPLNEVLSIPFGVDVDDVFIKTSYPKDLSLPWAKRGDWTVSLTDSKTHRTLHAHFGAHKALSPEVNMPSPSQLSPYFMISSLKSWEVFGASVYKENEPKAKVTKEILALSNKIVGSKKDLEAAKAIYDWIAENIQYVAVYLNSSQGYISHSASEILQEGYGDCKDHVTLMRSLLKAQNIVSYPVLVNWGSLYEPYALPTGRQFDHMMIYLPAYNVFANPTDSFSSFSVLGEGLDGKFVVICTPTGKTAFLPTPAPEANQYRHDSTITIHTNGDLSGTESSSATGFVNDLMRQHFFSQENINTLAQNLLNTSFYGGAAQMTLVGSPKKLSALFSTKSSWESLQALDMEDTIPFVVPIGIDFFNPQIAREAFSVRKRRFPFLGMSFHQVWSYILIPPPGYHFGRLSKDKSVENSMGSFSSTHRIEKDRLVVTRTLISNKAYLSAEEYGLYWQIINAYEQECRSIDELVKD